MHAGPLSTGRMTAQFARTGPCEVQGLQGVHSWLGEVSGYASTVFIVETEKTRPISS